MKFFRKCREFAEFVFGWYVLPAWQSVFPPKAPPPPPANRYGDGQTLHED